MTAHAILGASSAERWMTCPGSVRLCADLPDRSSEHARLGTAAHALGETCLLTGDAPFEYLGDPAPQDDVADIEVDTDMVEAVDVYVDHCRDLVSATNQPIKRDMVEQRVSLEKLGPWAEGMFGTGDFLWYDKKGKRLYVRDYKHGAGVAVEVEGNPQLKYYGLGAALIAGVITKVGDAWTAKAVTVDVGIIQPRKPHADGPVRTHQYSAKELLRWAFEEVEPAVIATDKEDAPLVPSEKGCKFCKAKGICPALAKQAQETAMLDFDYKPAVAADKLGPEDVAKILASEKHIRDWLDGVKSLAEEQLALGNDITGGTYKRVAGRKSRKWADEREAAKRLLGLGLRREDVFTEKLATPAQAEKLAGKERKKDLKELIIEEQGKPTLVPVGDKRPALEGGPQADFGDSQ